MKPSKFLLLGSVGASLLLAAYLVFASFKPANEERGDTATASSNGAAIGVFTTLPLFWAEADDVAQQLTIDRAPHWALTALTQQGEPVPLDTLSPDTIGDLSRLVLAQPRALSGAENVALDNWVRAGGSVLIFADPALTEHSDFAIGDPRRPQDVALLSPILSRWGLELTFDPRQADADRIIAFGGSPLVTRQSGRLQITPGAAVADCELRAEGLIARCRTGIGTATVIADAALLEAKRGGEAERAMLRNLTELAWGSD